MRRKALVGRDPCCPLHPWIARHVAGLPQGSLYTFVQHDKRAHEAFLPLLCSELQGFRKTNKPLKILGSRDEGQGFSCTAFVHAWPTEEGGNQQPCLYGGFLHDVIKSSSPVSPLTMLPGATVGEDQLHVSD